MEMASANDNVPQKQTTVEPSLLSLRHVDNVIPTFNRPGALASGIILIITGFLGIIFVIVISSMIEDSEAAQSQLQYFSNFWLFPYLVSELRTFPILSVNANLYALHRLASVSLTLDNFPRSFLGLWNWYYTRV